MSVMVARTSANHLGKEGACWEKAVSGTSTVSVLLQCSTYTHMGLQAARRKLRRDLYCNCLPL